MVYSLYFYRWKLQKVQATDSQHKNKRTFQGEAAAFQLDSDPDFSKCVSTGNIPRKTAVAMRKHCSLYFYANIFRRGAGLYFCVMHVTFTRNAFITLLCLLAFTWNALLLCLMSIASEITPWMSIVAVYGKKEVMPFMHYTPFTEGKLSTFPQSAKSVFALAYTLSHTLVPKLDASDL